MSFNGLFIALILFCSHLAHAQSGQAELTGEVRDQTGAVVANATVKITELSTNRTVNTTTSDAGIYAATNLKPGRYSITVDASGFKQTLREQLTLSTGERLRIDVTLETGAISEASQLKTMLHFFDQKAEASARSSIAERSLTFHSMVRNFYPLFRFQLVLRNLRQPVLDLHFQELMGAVHEPTSTCSMEFRCCSPNRDKSHSFPFRKRFRNSKSKLTARGRSLGGSMEASSISQPGLAQTISTVQLLNFLETKS